MLCSPKGLAFRPAGADFNRCHNQCAKTCNFRAIEQASSPGSSPRVEALVDCSVSMTPSGLSEGTEKSEADKSNSVTNDGGSEAGKYRIAQVGTDLRCSAHPTAPGNRKYGQQRADCRCCPDACPPCRGESRPTPTEVRAGERQWQGEMSAHIRADDVIAAPGSSSVKLSSCGWRRKPTDGTCHSYNYSECQSHLHPDCAYKVADRATDDAQAAWMDTQVICPKSNSNSMEVPVFDGWSFSAGMPVSSTS